MDKTGCWYLGLEFLMGSMFIIYVERSPNEKPASRNR